MTNGSFLVTELGRLVSFARFDVIRRFIAAASVSSHQKCRLKLIYIRGGVGKAAASMRVRPLAAMVPHLPISNLYGCLLNQLVVILVLL